VAEGAEPLKPLIAILLTALLISNSVVAGFRGEKNEVDKDRLAMSLLW